jgi:hypothetical protein
VSDEAAAVEADEPDAPALPPAAPRTASEAALARYSAGLRRGRIVYYAILAAAVAALSIWAGVTLSGGEAAHASLHTHRPAPATLAVTAPSASQQRAWATADHIALGNPQSGGTVVTYSTHTVGGRNARTGARTWSYTRSDRDVCTAAQASGVTVAIYANHGNCDELTALDSGTGRRLWTRTLDIDGMPINGSPTYQVGPSTVLVASHSVVYAIATDSGYDRWTYQRFGCRIGQVVLGSAGALISQTCSDQVHCAGIKFCGRGPQLLLRDGMQGRADGKPNADQIFWNQIGDAGVPVSADDVVSAVAPSGTDLMLYATDHGTHTGSVPLAAGSTALGAGSAVAVGTDELIWLSGTTYAVSPAASAASWRKVTRSAPTVPSAGDGSAPSLAAARITVPTSTGIAILGGKDGKVVQRFTVPPPAPGSVVYSLGTGFLVAGPSGVVAYR